MGALQPAIRDRVCKLARDPYLEVKLQVAIAARKSPDVDPVPVLVDVLLNSVDPLIPHIVWQNLHPLLESRQADVVRRFATRTIAELRAQCHLSQGPRAASWTVPRRTRKPFGS